MYYPATAKDTLREVLFAVKRENDANPPDPELHSLETDLEAVLRNFERERDLDEATADTVHEALLCAKRLVDNNPQDQWYRSLERDLGEALYCLDCAIATAD